MPPENAHQAREAPVAYHIERNRNRSDFDAPTVPIPGEESERFALRLNEVIGDEQHRAFARRINISEGVLRAYLSGKSLPGMAALAAISEATGVTIDWLVTGRLPKSRAELRHCTNTPAPPPLDASRLRQALALAEVAATSLGQPLSADQRADMALAFYQRLHKGEA
ncbi:MAG: helix-turn-helix domain-containing protein [Sulfuricellaceae bacterium]